MPDIRTVDLRAEAIAEARRLTLARTVLREGDDRALVQLEGDPAWIALAKRNGRRRTRGRRVYLVWRVAFEDESGRLVESRLVPIVVELAGVPGKATRRAWILTLLRETDASVRAHVEAAASEWRAAAARLAAACAEARSDREHASVRRSSGASGSASQPGLFDRRAERSQTTQAAALAAREHATADRLRTISALTAIALRPARLLLVLVP
jgi:hypothetical protein